MIMDDKRIRNKNSKRKATTNLNMRNSSAKLQYERKSFGWKLKTWNARGFSGKEEN